MRSYLLAVFLPVLSASLVTANDFHVQTQTTISPSLTPRASSLRGGLWDSDCGYKGEFNEERDSTTGGGYRPAHKASCNPRLDENGFKEYITKLDLNHCLVNMNGDLKWAKDGNAFQSCKSCSGNKSTQNRYLTCMCGTGAGSALKNTTTDLSEGLYVQDGRVSCFDVIGSLSVGGKEIPLTISRRGIDPFM